ncbi:FadR/GntR family transcriptional regulator [Azospirillum sp. A39]|uniref:FadR/GntR family transcriptional regulator n=1 Tax=Azospirillum sp. A39 TaxID=3462279 RepID=UPI004045E415
MSNGESAALVQLRAYLAAVEPPFDSRLPPERALCERLGVPRPALRKALAVLEQEGQIWRHVGKGTFVGSRPLDSHADVAAIARRTNPAEVMRTRLLLEPEVAAQAAIVASPAHVAEMRTCLARSRGAASWRQYETWDNRFHRAIAEATQNGLLLALLDTLNAVRRAVTWGRLRADRDRPPPDHHSFGEHEAIVAAIADRDADHARTLMRAHLEQVGRNLLRSGLT